jgi:hypothetical protein
MTTLRTIFEELGIVTVLPAFPTAEENVALPKTKTTSPVVQQYFTPVAPGA